MHRTLTQKPRLSLPVRPLAILASLILSYYTQLNSLVNFDGILYLRTAQTYLDHGFKAASLFYDRPFYSLFIANLHQASGLSLEQSAYTLNALLLALIVVCFITLCSDLASKKGTNDTENHQNKAYEISFYAALLIVVFPHLNQYRDMLIRDFGYWAFLLSALILLIRFIAQPRLYTALLWNVALSLAILFRPEALLFFFTAPLLIATETSLNIKEKIKQSSYLLGPPLCATLFFLLYVSLTHSQAFSAVNKHVFALVHNYQIEPFFQSIYQNFYKTAQLFPDQVSHYIDMKYALVMLFFALLAYFSQTLISTLHLLYALFSAYGIKKSLIPPSSARRALLFHLIISLAIPLVFLYKQYFLSGRYMLLPCLLILPWGVFSLADIVRKNTHNRLISLTLLLLLFSGITSFGYSKAFIREASVWLSQQGQKEQTLYTNNARIAYYTQNLTPNWDSASLSPRKALAALLLKPGHLDYDFYAIVIKNKNPQIKVQVLNFFPMNPIVHFQNKRGDGVYIFKNTAKT